LIPTEASGYIRTTLEFAIRTRSYNPEATTESSPGGAMPTNNSPDLESMADANSAKSTVNSVLKALNILECFSADAPEHSVAELARRTKINKATCHRLVATMVKAGWLVRSSSANYRPSLKVFRIGAPALGDIDLRDHCHEVLRELAAEFGDTAYLMMPDGDRAVCVDRFEGNTPVRVMVVEVGSSLPLNVGAAPLAMLAHRDDLLEELSDESLPRLTPETVSTMAELRVKLEEIREHGFSTSFGDIVDGVSAIGAPIHDADGTVIGALSLGGLAPRFEPPRREIITARIIEAAARVSSQLGYIEPAAA
jgi:DNA-binding IclR family transcriptional regulator